MRSDGLSAVANALYQHCIDDEGLWLVNNEILDEVCYVLKRAIGYD